MICCCSVPPAAYFSGGEIGGGPSFTNLTDKLIFATQITAAKTTANLTSSVGGPFGVGDANNNGYIAGGGTSSSTGITSAVQLFFATDTHSALTAVMSQARFLGASTGDRSTKGYFCGGQTSASGQVVTTDKITFAGPTIAALTACNLAVSNSSFAGTTNGSTKGYLLGSFITGGISQAGSRITFASDTIAVLTGAALSPPRELVAGTSNGTTAAYFMGGDDFSGSSVNNTDKLTFASETTAAFTTARLTTDKYGSASAGDGITFSYIAGGFRVASNLIKETDVLTYSTETCASVTTAQLSVARDLVTGTATTGFG